MSTWLSVMLWILGYLVGWCAYVRLFVIIETKKNNGKRTTLMEQDIFPVMAIGLFWPVVGPAVLFYYLLSWIAAQPTQSERQRKEEAQAQKDLEETIRSLSWRDDYDLKNSLAEVYNSRASWRDRINIPERYDV